MAIKKNEYTADSIKVLNYPENIQTRPTMYIGSIGISGNTHLAKEVIDNAVDEALNGYGNEIRVEISNSKGTCRVIDKGRGIPHDAIEKAFTVLHSSGKFDTGSYSVSAGTNGVGTTAVNALSTIFKVTTVNNKIQYSQVFKNGLASTKAIKNAENKLGVGTKVEFIPNEKIMGTIEFDKEIIKNELSLKSYVNKGIKFIFKDIDTNTEYEYYHKDGIIDFIKERGNLLYDPIVISNDSELKVKKQAIKSRNSEEEITFKVHADIVLSHSKKNVACDVKGFCNSLYTPLDGTHVTGFKIGITSNIKKYIDANNILTKKDSKLEITGDNIQDGLIAVVAIKYPNAMYSSQTKEKLANSELQGYVLKIINEELPKWMDSHPKEMKALCNKIILSAKADNAAKRAKENISKKGESTLTAVSDLSKLAVCNSKDPKERELFITEGDSAASSAKGCRDKQTQAIYALRGKIMNSNNVEIHKIFENKELSDLIYILTGKPNSIGDKYDESNLKYNMVNVMCDADDDGLNIISLVITFFYKHMREIITNGHLYVCLPPLYSIIENGKKKYFLDQEEYDDYINKKINKIVVFRDNGVIVPSNKQAKLFTILNKYKEKLSEVYQFTGIPENLLDITASYRIANSNCTMGDLVKYIKTFGEIKFVKNEQGLPELKGLFEDKYINIIYNELINETNTIIAFRNKIKYNSAIQVSYDKVNFVDINNKVFSELIDKVTPKSRVRFKGLGEMDADELWKTTMNPATRNLYQVVLNDEKRAAETQEDLFNPNQKYADRRKVFLIKNQAKRREIDLL